MPGLVEDPRFVHQHPYEFMHAQRAVEAANEAREAALAGQQRRAPSARAGTAAGPSTTSRKRKAVDSPPFQWPHCPSGAKRPRYTAADFQTPFATKEQIRSWYSRFVAFLGKRNFYVLQEHHATAKHWDLRIQLDGGLVSFCIPKGLFDFEVEERGRYVVWQPVHPIHDCLVEGGSVGDKKVDDLGWYEMLHTLSWERAREQIRKQGFDDAETTDEDEDAQPEDEKQEDLFAQGSSSCSFFASSQAYP
ncbi:hypothetical protein BCR35DRAFT_111486 [Leucosporidium creatinivorum]|uniref:DNA ligase D 3'-phosphoesterase domain-containing protein n=1 Tax=Leucosporidium creatinivorum TaxID=106004 RepID=A0A1Y2F2F2_9BASI|nr:hypothetical protein BCR35DRAFT_111486 [Leucosporidium creatinivorum]